MPKARLIHQSLTHQFKEIYTEVEASQIAFLLLEHFAKVSKLEILANRELDEFDESLFQNLEKRILAHEPIQYIIGEVNFMDCIIKVNPSVLIPRPETEELVSRIVEIYKNQPDLSVLDICTGSGCIPIALSKNLPITNVFGLDVSSEAIAIAQENALLNSQKVQFQKVDILKEDLSDFPDLNIIISNPPYVRESEKAEMQKNVLEYEPNLALFVSDTDPLIFYQRISKLAYRKLKKRGTLYFEINEVFGQEVFALAKEVGFQNIEIWKDLNGKDRFLKAEK